jgi:hypothetical protein
MIPSSASRASLPEADTAAEPDARCYTNAWGTTEQRRFDFFG